MKKSLFLFFGTLIANVLYGQMSVGADTLFGNEWIDFSKTYYKVKVAEDGIYRIPAAAIAAAGIPSSVPASQFRLYCNGREKLLYASTESALGGQDYLEFFGEKNRSQLDQYLFNAPSTEMVNPDYSLFNDTSVYFLVWTDSGVGLRFQKQDNVLTNLPPKEPWCWFENRRTFMGYHLRREASNGIVFSFFDGNGFCAGSSTESESELKAPDLYAQGPDAQFTVRYACNLGQHAQEVWLNGQLSVDTAFNGWKTVEHDIALPIGSLKTTNTLKIVSTGDNGDVHYLSGIALRYPRNLAFGNVGSVRFELAPSTEKRYLEIEDFDGKNGAPILYDLSAGLRIETFVDNGVVKVVLPPFATSRHFLLVSPDKIRNSGPLSARRFRDYRSEKATTYLIVSTPVLYRDPAENGKNQVEAYAAYRRSLEGGNYAVTIADIDELYDQFAYGIRFHPFSIRNFLHYAKQQWPALHYALLIGKPLDYDFFRTSADQAALADSLFFLPNYGTIGADWPFAMLPNQISAPIVTLGRLAVTQPKDIGHYLDKLKAQERQTREAPQTLEDRAWMRRVIHNSGGRTDDDPFLRALLGEMKDVLSNNRFGADVLSYYKTSNDPIQMSAFEQMLDKINGGVSLWTIYGHSSTFSVAFEIGQPQNYSNKDRYPFMMVLGCYAGLCSARQKSLGEQFTLVPDRGAIAYCASVNLGLLSDLYIYGRRYYERLGGDDYGASIGDIMRHTIVDLNQNPGISMTSFLHQVLLQGDPAVRLNPHPGPDYLIDKSSVVFDPNPISVEQASFGLSFDLANIGQHTGEPVVLKIDQRLPDGTLLTRILDTVPAPPFRRTLRYVLPTKGSQLGFNRFFISVDPDNAVAELPAAAELNNELTDVSGEKGLEVYFYADDIQAVYPPNYAILTQKDPVLYTSSLNTNAPEQRYLFELDTVETFDSPFKKTMETKQRGGLIAWKPLADYREGTVYYWRIARDSIVNGKLVWRQRSFLYAPNSAGGWNQSHFGQYLDGTLANLKADLQRRRLAYSDNAGFLSLQLAYRGVERYPGLNNSYYEGFTGDYGLGVHGVTDGVLVVVVDPKTGYFLNNPQGGPYSIVGRESMIFAFTTRDSLQRIKLMDFIERVVPPDHYVGLMALGYAGDPVGYAPDKWAADSITYGKNLFSVLEAQGAKEVRQVTTYPAAGPRPYGLLFQKGNPAFATDTFVSHPDSVYFMSTSFLNKWPSGFWESPVIGPARQWQSLHWQLGTADSPTETGRFGVYAVRPNTSDTLVIQLDGVFDTTLVSTLSAAQFPLLKLRYEARDTSARTLTQLKYARLLFEGLPEGALHPALYNFFYRDTLQQGETMRSAIAFTNLSNQKMDSVLVKFRIENSANAGTDFFKKYRPLAPGDTLLAAFDADTRSLNGLQRLLVDVNPNQAQPELYHFNNVGLRTFFVARDGRNPLLDVTFDGTHILNGDLVSPKPDIRVRLKDDNRFLAMTDTSTFNLSLERPDGSLQRVYFSDPTLVFTPANPAELPAKNDAWLEWRPVFEQDGDYRLLVNGRDAAGNASAALDYSVAFKVINKSSISNILNYPNPFSTSTCFVYTMTGAETPAHFKIQILTVSGRVVREITEQEFGGLQTGTHRSNFCWDGKDEYGDQLANGVYLYRIVAKKADGSDFDLFENAPVDGFFKNGLGKMVLMR